MSNPVTPFRNNLFASRGMDIQSALDYAEMMINTLSATDQVAVRTAFGVVINTIDSAVTQSQGPSPEMDQADMLSQLGGIYDKLVNDVASKVEAKIMTNDKIDESIEEWMTLNLRDKVMSIVEDDDISDQISNWMSNNFDVEDYNVGDAIESWADRNLEDKIQETINNLTFTVNVN